MSDRLYDDLIMDHIKNARNYRAIDGADREAGGANPLCGDEMRVYVRMDGERIAEAAFQCTCCGISMASASIMTERVAGASAEQAGEAAREFLSALSEDVLRDDADPERRALLDAVRKYPMRRRCAPPARRRVGG